MSVFRTTFFPNPKRTLIQLRRANLTSTSKLYATNHQRDHLHDKLQWIIQGHCSKEFDGKSLVSVDVVRSIQFGLSKVISPTGVKQASIKAHWLVIISVMIFFKMKKKYDVMEDNTQKP